MSKEKSAGRMGTEPMNKLVLKMGMPIVLSMMLQAVYNIVDSAFVSNMPLNGEAALNALTLAFPVQMLMVAVGIGTGVGANALVSKNLGMGNREKASRAAGNALFMAAIISGVFMLFGIFGVRAYTCSQTDNPPVAEMTIKYLRICCVVSVGIEFFAVFEKLLQATGRSAYSTAAQILGAVVNIILDPIFIYGLLGLPAMGVSGAAWATVIGQSASLAAGMFFHLRMNKEIGKGAKYLKPSPKLLKELYAVGLPAIIAQALMSVMTYGMNVILGKIGEAAVTAYGLYYKIQQFILFAAFGLRDAITPIISFNYGMGSKKRVNEGIRLGQLYTFIIMCFGLILIELFAEGLAAVFGLSGETQGLCVQAMRLVSLSFVFAGVNIAYQGVFQALDGGMEALTVSLCRQLVFVLPLAWGFSFIARQNPSRVWLVWLSFLIAEGASAAVSLMFMRQIRKKRIDGALE